MEILVIALIGLFLYSRILEWAQCRILEIKLKRRLRDVFPEKNGKL